MRTGFEGDRPVPNGIGVVDGVLRAAMATLRCSDEVGGFGVRRQARATWLASGTSVGAQRHGCSNSMRTTENQRDERSYEREGNRGRCYGHGGEGRHGRGGDGVNHARGCCCLAGRRPSEQGGT